MKRTYSPSFFTNQKINRPPTPGEMRIFINEQKKIPGFYSSLTTPENTYKQITANETTLNRNSLAK